MGREHDRLAEGGEVLHDLPGVAPGGGIEAGGRLVQEQEVGVARQADPHVEATLLAAGEFVDAGAGLLLQAHDAEDLAGGPGVRVVAAVEVDGLLHREERFDARLLEHDADALQQRPLPAGRIVAQDPDFAGVGGAVALEDLDGGRLAGAVGAEEGEDLTPCHFEIDAPHGLDVTVGLLQALDDDGRRVLHGGEHIARSLRLL